MMPRGSRALLPAEIRTPPNRSPGWPMLSWVFASPERSSHAVEAASRLLPSCAFDAASTGDATSGASGPYRTHE
jgi:hypothetical protein